MNVTMQGISRIAAAAAVVCLAGASKPASAGGTVVIGATASVASYNPYADSQAMPYGVWCQTYGCLGTYDYRKGEYVGLLAERWEVDKEDPRNWLFHLRKGLKRHGDGKELTADDVVHSFKRIRTDPDTRQTSNIRPVEEVVAVDKHTVKVVTKVPTAPLLEFLFDRVIITGKDLFQEHGARKADREYPWGWGPYEIKEVRIGQRIVLEKVPEHPWATPENPDVLIFSIMREPEQRVTALVNGEIQIAQYVPPHLTKRVEESPNAKVAWTSSNRMIFLAMSPKHEPWDDRLLRKAVCHAIDRDALIEHVLGGYAERLDGPIGPGQYGYDPEFSKDHLTVPYDPAKARALVEQSDYNDEEVELVTTVGRFINDKQINEAIVPMLNAVGIRATLRAPEYSTMWSNVQKGNLGFYYIGRGGMVDPSVALAQYFETGGSPRIGISDPEIDKALAKERVTFDPVERKKALNEAFKAIVDAAPACFMWRHHVLYGLAENVTYEPSPSDRVFGFHMRVKQ